MCMRITKNLENPSSQTGPARFFTVHMCVACFAITEIVLVFTIELLVKVQITITKCTLIKMYMCQYICAHVKFA